MAAQTLEKLVRVVGVLGILVLAIVVWSSVEMKHFKETVPRPILQLEIARSPDDFAAVLTGNPDGNVAQARRQLKIDGFFIASYWLFFLGLAALIVARQPASGWTGAVTAAITTAGAAFDLKENQGILAALDAYARHALTVELVRNTREASLMKWALLFVALLLLARLFLWGAVWRRVLGILVATGGAAGLCGLFCPTLACELTLITSGMSLAFLAMFPFVVEFLFRPASFAPVSS